MYGVPPNLDLSFLRGRSLTMVGIGEFQLQFHFHPDGLISVEGKWELIGADGSELDRSRDNSERDEYRVHRLLGQEVVATELDPPQSFSLQFGNGMMLRIFDDSEQYESFSIHPGDIYV